MLVKSQFAVPLLAFAFGCATAYQPTGLGGGYSDTHLAPDLFRVVFHGNQYTAPDRVQDFALLRASELALQNGFTCFALIDESNTVTSSTFNTPAHANATGSGYINGNSVTFEENTTYYPSQTYTFYKPNTGLLIKAFKSKPDRIFTFDAGFLQQSLKEKYQIK